MSDISITEAIARAKAIQAAVDRGNLGRREPGEAETPSSVNVGVSSTNDSANDEPKPLSVFVSWAHSHRTWDRVRIEKWERSVAEFTTTLRQDAGLDADVDLYHLSDPEVDWTRLGPSQILDADFTIVVMSRSWAERWAGRNLPTEGAGAAAEADTLHGLYNRNQQDWQRRLKIVQFPDSDGEIPPELERIPRFRVDPEDFSTYEELIRTLTNQPAYQKPPISSVPTLPSAVLKGASKAAGANAADSDTKLLVAELNEVALELAKGSTSQEKRDALVQRKAVLETVLDAMTKSD